MRILLAGGTGFVGKHFRRRLERDGHEIVLFTRHGTITTLMNETYDTIINCAAELDTPEFMEDSNVTLVQDLLWACKRKGSRMIQLGSSSETGPVEGPRSETTFCRPTNFYEATKLAATNLCLGYAGEWNVNVAVARPFSLYGSHDKLRKMLPTLWRAYRDNFPFSCFCGGHDWTHIDDFAEGIVKLLGAPREITQGQIFHFGTGRSTSNEEIVRLFEAAVGKKLDVTYHTGRFRYYDVMDWRADWSKAKTLGWEPKVTIEEGVRRFVEEQQSQT